MSNFFEEVRDFHQAFDLPIGECPEFPKEQSARELRKNLLKEEYEEYLEAEANDDIVEVADALADIIYIALGTAVHYGIPLDKVFEEVHRSNMAKLGEDGKPIRREDGKVLKPAGWTPPNIKNILMVSTAEHIIKKLEDVICK